METENHDNEQFMRNLINNACEANLNAGDYVNLKSSSDINFFKPSSI